MGANASTAVPLYASGQVLDAARLNLTNAGIPVFSGTATRDAAFGGSGEKVLAEGQFAYLEDTNAVQYYDSAAWQAVGASGLTFITGTTFTTATSVSLPASTFSSTYYNYKLLLDITAVATDSTFTMRMRAAGADNTNASYSSMFMGISDGGVATNKTGADGTSFNLGESDASFIRYSLVLDIIAPQVSTSATKIFGGYTFVNTTPTAAFGTAGACVFTATTSFDSLTFISSQASSITGVYRVYGYANS